MYKNGVEGHSFVFFCFYEPLYYLLIVGMYLFLIQKTPDKEKNFKERFLNTAIAAIYCNIFHKEIKYNFLF